MEARFRARDETEMGERRGWKRGRETRMEARFRARDEDGSEISGERRGWKRDFGSEISGERRGFRDRERPRSGERRGWKRDGARRRVARTSRDARRPFFYAAPARARATRRANRPPPKRVFSSTPDGTPGARHARHARLVVSSFRLVPPARASLLARRLSSRDVGVDEAADGLHRRFRENAHEHVPRGFEDVARPLPHGSRRRARRRGGQAHHRGERVCSSSVASSPLASIISRIPAACSPSDGRSATASSAEMPSFAPYSP